MLIEDTVELAIVAYLAGATNLPIYRGLQNQDPNLALPALVVTCQSSNIIPARRELYRVRVVIEYKSIPEESSVADIEAALQQVDIALTTQPATINSSPGLAKFLAWIGIPRTLQEVHTDRRTNSREIDAVLGFS